MRLARGSAACLVCTVIVAVGIVFPRICRTPEWTVLTGSRRNKERICRTVCRKSAVRASWCLRRLLAERSPQIRIAAIEALSRRPDLHGRLTKDVLRLVDTSAPQVRIRALEFLLQNVPEHRARLFGQARRHLSTVAACQEHSGLMLVCVRAMAESNHADTVPWLLGMLDAVPDSVLRNIHVLGDFPEVLRPHRTDLVSRLDASEERQRLLLVHWLTSVDGVMRGYRGSDWEDTGGRPVRLGAGLPALDRFTFEAEWASDIRPNYQIDEKDGELCLHLDEGAGGYMAWLQREHSTVDIGTATFSFSVSRDGPYQIWLRCWLKNKCGNSTGIRIDGTPIGAFSDRTDVFNVWHWRPVAGRQWLRRGRHRFDITAFEDAVFLDKFALTPAGVRFDVRKPPPPNPLYGFGASCSLSFTTECQSQPRDTAQTITVWVRRNSLDIGRGEVRLEVPAPFEVVSDQAVAVEFEQDMPIASAPFRVAVAADAVGGEVQAEAWFEVDGKPEGKSILFLGVTHDWYTTGPLNPRGAKARNLMRKRKLDENDLRHGWTPYPAKGYDRYRRFAFEQAYGETQDKVVFLVTEIEVAEGGKYLSLLTLDDYGYVYVGGQRIAGRAPTMCLGEGRMLMDRCRVKPGRHQVFLWVCQAAFADPRGHDAGRHSFNNWVCKWLLRRGRHRIAGDVRGIPFQLPGAQ